MVSFIRAVRIELLRLLGREEEAQRMDEELKMTMKEVL